MKYWYKTDRGLVRSQNQDAVFSFCSPEDDFALLLVCDGMGGAKAGNVASSLAAETFSSYIMACYEKSLCADNIEEHITQAVRAANEKIYSLSSAEEDYHGMGTTLVAAIVIGMRAYVVNIGDSRCYHINPRYGIRQITRDHSVVADLVERGDITRAESIHHPNKNLITRAIGTAPNIRPDIFFINLEEEDTLLLCSDGISNTIDDQEFVFEVLREKDPAVVGQRLIQLSLDRGAPDNISVVLFQR